MRLCVCEWVAVFVAGQRAHLKDHRSGIEGRTGRELLSQVFYLQNPTPEILIFWLQFQLRRTLRFFSLRTSGLSQILVLQFEDAHMDRKKK